MEFKYKMGATLKEIVTGYTGVVMVRAEYFTGCVHYGLCPKKLTKDGEIGEWSWIDETLLVRVATTAILKKAPRTSGPMPKGPSL